MAGDTLVHRNAGNQQKHITLVGDNTRGTDQLVFEMKMKHKNLFQNKLRSLKINFKHHYKTQMLLKTTHNELCFGSTQLQNS